MAYLSVSSNSAAWAYSFVWGVMRQSSVYPLFSGRGIHYSYVTWTLDLLRLFPAPSFISSELLWEEPTLLLVLGLPLCASQPPRITTAPSPRLEAGAPPATRAPSCEVDAPAPQALCSRKLPHLLSSSRKPACSLAWPPPTVISQGECSIPAWDAVLPWVHPKTVLPFPVKEDPSHKDYAHGAKNARASAAALSEQPP